MKICLVFCDLKQSSGVSNVAIEIANLLSKKYKYDITLAPIYEWGPSVRWRINNNVHVRHILPFYFKGFSHIFNKIPDRWLYKYLVGDNKFDLVIAFQYGKATRIVANGAMKEQHTLGWMHCYDEGLLLESEYKKLGKMICVSKCNANRLSNETNNTIPVDFCYNPIDDKQIVSQAIEPINFDNSWSNGIQFVTVGRLSKEKGYQRLINILHKLKSEGYSFHLRIIGDGPERDALCKQVENLNLVDDITFLGSIKNPHKYTKRSDVFLCSSFIEGYSTACTEAIILGVPVISTNCAGGEEIIKEAEAGTLTLMDDDSLYSAIKKVLQDPSIIQDWKDTLKKTKYKFCQEARISKISKIIKDAAER